MRTRKQSKRFKDYYPDQDDDNTENDLFVSKPAQAESSGRKSDLEELLYSSKSKQAKYFIARGLIKHIFGDRAEIFIPMFQ